MGGDTHRTLISRQGADLLVVGSRGLGGVREAILDPDHRIVDGYDDVMEEPDLTEKEVEDIIAYLKTLK